MSRIEGSTRPVTITPPAPGTDTAPAKPAVASSVAQVARTVGFSGASQFTGPTPPPASGFGTAPSGARKLSANDLGVIPQNQGNTNACGTTSLANVMTHFGMPRTHEQIDGSIRPFDMFTAPDRLVDYANANGMRASMKNDASLDDLARMVDQGVPPMVLIDPDTGDNFNLHYVTVTGYERGADGKISDIVLADSAGGRRYSVDAEKFQQMWDNVKVGGLGMEIPSGLNNVMITAVPKDGRSITGGDGVTRKASDIQLPKSGFWSDLKSGVARGLSNILSLGAQGVEKTWQGIKWLGGVLGNAASAVGGFVSNAASAVGGFFKSIF